MARLESKLKDSSSKWMERMEQRLEEVTRQVRQEQTVVVVSALTSSITKMMEQVVSQEIKRMLHSLADATFLGELKKNRMAKELATSQSREFISHTVAKSVIEMVEGS